MYQLFSSSKLQITANTQSYSFYEALPAKQHLSFFVYSQVCNKIPDTTSNGLITAISRSEFILTQLINKLLKTIQEIWHKYTVKKLVAASTASEINVTLIFSIKNVTSTLSKRTWTL